jgi:hypothetical protein
MAFWFSGRDKVDELDAFGDPRSAPFYNDKREAKAAAHLLLFSSTPLLSPDGCMYAMRPSLSLSLSLSLVVQFTSNKTRVIVPARERDTVSNA